MLSASANDLTRSRLRDAPLAIAYTRGRHIITVAISKASSSQSTFQAAKDSVEEHGDPEREHRACETAIYVLRTLGSRILGAGLVDLNGLREALSAIDDRQIKLLDLKANELFRSLTYKLQDVTLLNSFFASLYFLGFILERFPRSLPQYKKEYPSLGPKIVLELFRSAIGEDALRENLNANIYTYQNLVSIMGLVIETHTSSSIFPGKVILVRQEAVIDFSKGFPSFPPCRYPTKSVGDMIQHRATLGKLVKHFENHGFPQPLPGLNAGPIRSWGFLSGSISSRNFEVAKVDKHIGQDLGRIIYWLICEAHRLPTGRATIAYYDQYIALVRYFGEGFGFRILNAGQDLDMSGSHQALSGKLRSVFDTWVIIVPTPTILTPTREADMNPQSRLRPDALHMSGTRETLQHHRSNSTRSSATSLYQPTTQRTPSISSIIRRKARSFTLSNKSSITSLVSSLSSTSINSCRESMDGTVSRRSTDRAYSPSVQKTQSKIPNKASAISPHSPSTDPLNARRDPSEPQFSYQAHFESAAENQQTYPSSDSIDRPSKTFPPRPVTLAVAIYAFEPDEEYNDDELTFSEGDILEIVEKSKSLEEYGWCVARMRGQSWTRLAPLEYLKETSSLPPDPLDLSTGRVTGLIVPEQTGEDVQKTNDHHAAEVSSLKTFKQIVDDFQASPDEVVQGKRGEENDFEDPNYSTSKLQFGLHLIFLLYYFLMRCLEPLPEPGKTRVRWRCKCGYQSYDDFEELAPGGIDEWKVFLRQYFDHESGPSGNSRQPPFQSLVSWVTHFFQSQRNSDEDDDSSWNPPNLSLPISMSSGQTWTTRRKVYILLAFPYRRWGSRLSQPDIKHLISDRAFFQLLRTSYSRTRSRAKQLLSLKTIKSVEFAQLELHESGIVDINTALPVPDLPNDADYIYDPKPPKRNPPVGANFLMHLIFHPEEANGGKSPCSEKIPKRIQRLQPCIDSGVGLGWGLHFKEGWDMNVFWLVTLSLGVFGVFVFFICWASVRQDPVGASNIAAFVVGMIALLIASVQALIAMDAV